MKSFLSALRFALDLSQTKFAERAGLKSRHRVCRIERGLCVLTAEELERILAVLQDRTAKPARGRRRGRR